MNKKVRKLALSRETVRDLSARELQNAAAAASELVNSCTCPRPCSLASCVSECTQCSDCCM